jgi:hypothetical protein
MKSDAYKAGLEMRRKVLGADYVDANIKTATSSRAHGSAV